MARPRAEPVSGVVAPSSPVGAARPDTTPDGLSERRPVVAIAASTGGPSEVAALLAGLAGLDAPVVIVQHLHTDFIDGFVTWMARVSALPVELATHGAILQAGVVHVAPGGTHLKVGVAGRVVLDPEPVTLHRPSADELFLSLAARGTPAVGVVLTGMGDDGAQGLLALRRRGAVTIVQDEATSAVFGMPQAAVRVGAAMHVLPIDRIAGAILSAVKR